MTRTTTRALVGAALAAAVCAVPSALAAPSGAAFTTDASGARVNENHYASADAVYLDGGPPCHASRRSARLPDGRYLFRVTTPSGKVDLSAIAGSDPADRAFTVRGGRVVSATAPALPSSCADSLVVQVGPFAESANGVYKLWIAPASAVSDGRFSARVSKTDNFTVEPDADGGGGGGGFEF